MEKWTKKRIILALVIVAALAFVAGVLVGTGMALSRPGIIRRIPG